MLRLVLIEVSLFLLPFVVWALVAAARRTPAAADDAGVVVLRDEARRRGRNTGGRGGRPQSRLFDGAPFGWLTLAGLVLVIAGFLALSAFQDAPLERTYVPDQFKDGKLVPGHFE